MQKRILRSSILVTAVLLLVGSLALPLGAKDKKQVTRPFKASGVMTVHYKLTSPTTASFRNVEEGVATFTGRYLNVSEGTTSFVSGLIEASGTVRAANGDTVHWVFDTGNRFVVDGGTGRFDKASGYFLWTVVDRSDPVYDPDGLGFTVTMLATYEGEVTF